MNPLQEGLWWMKNRFPRLAWKLRWLRPSRVSEKRRWTGKSTQQVFEAIYEQNMWGSPESRSGAGSTLRATEKLRAALPVVLKECGIRSMLDAPCGDFNWMQACDLGVDTYIGGDIVPKIIADLQAKYGNEKRSFRHLDVTSDPLPKTDVFFCRDLFLHLSFEQIEKTLANFVKSETKYLIASTYVDVRINIDHFTGGARMVHLCLPPFNLPQPTSYIDDPGEAKFDRKLGVWTREQVMARTR